LSGVYEIFATFAPWREIISRKAREERKGNKKKRSGEAISSQAK
jgi:hypothetical protein